jgi:hypothetical protein
MSLGEFVGVLCTILIMTALLVLCGYQEGVRVQPSDPLVYPWVPIIR